jgi:hypothetical protein
LRVRRPDREIDTFHFADRPQVRAEFFVDLKVVSLGEEMQIHLAHDDPVGVRIAHDRGRIVPPGEMNAIIEIASHPRQSRLEKSFTPEPLGRDVLLLFAREDDAHFLRVRPEDANGQIVAKPVRTQDPERIGMRAR